MHQLTKISGALDEAALGVGEMLMSDRHLAGEQETRAWTIKSGMTAPQAAGVIHTDFQKGFIRAETVAYSDFTDAGSY